MPNVLENLYVDSFIRMVCVYLVAQAKITTNDDAVTAAFFFAEGIYTISPTEMCEYLHSQYGHSKQLVLARVLQEAIAQAGIVEMVESERNIQTDAPGCIQQAEIEYNGVPYGDEFIR